MNRKSRLLFVKLLTVLSGALTLAGASAAVWLMTARLRGDEPPTASGLEAWVLVLLAGMTIALVGTVLHVWDSFFKSEGGKASGRQDTQ